MGFQIFAKKLYEHGISDGIGLIDSDVLPISDTQKFNIGWSSVLKIQSNSKRLTWKKVLFLSLILFKINNKEEKIIVWVNKI